MAIFPFSVKMQCFLLLLPCLISFHGGVISVNCLAPSPKYNAIVLVVILSFFCCFFFFYLQPGLWYIIMSGHWYNDLHQLFYVAVSHHNIQNHVFFLFSFPLPSLLPFFFFFLLQGKYLENSKSFS